MLGTADSAFLQQAAHVTGGLYLRPSRPRALLQYLLVRSCDAGIQYREAEAAVDMLSMHKDHTAQIIACDDLQAIIGALSLFDSV